MDLRKRLAQLDRMSRKRTTGADAQPAVSSAEREQGLVEQLELRHRQGVQGSFWQRDYVADEPQAPPIPFATRDSLLPQPGPADLNAEDLLLLDTETTGLVGGTGSLAFLVGLAWWRDGAFAVRQLFLAGPGQEEAMLAEIQRIAGRFRVVVTYNGNCFDLPLLRTRALLARCADPLAELVSWDLLTPARRLWGRRLANCRQQTIESMLRAEDRGPGDIDGAQIPQTYFHFLQAGEVGRLPEVLRHNRRDMEGMGEIVRAVLAAAAVLDRPAEELGDRPPAGQVGRPWGGPRGGQWAWQDAWSLGRVCEARRDTARAAAWFDIALEQATLAATAETALELPEGLFIDAVRIFKRAADWPRVLETLVWARQLFPQRSWLHREAAMLFEHRLGRPDLALLHAEAEGDEHRLARLRRKIGTL